MSEPVKIAIVMEGGMLSCVLSAGVPIEYVLIDYDADEEGDPDCFPVPQDGGREALAVGHLGIAEIHGERTLQLFECVNARDNPPHQFANSYDCPNCSHSWTDTWSAMCNENCPECSQKDVQPTSSQDLPECQCASCVASGRAVDLTED